jgi:uncharacterized HAD superfamily protein
MIVAVDFDGTLCEDKFPEIGVPYHSIIDALLRAQERGAKLILWTCRKGEFLNAAVDWCGARGLHFDAINANLPESIERYGGDTRKVCADFYIDDKNATLMDLSIGTLKLELKKERRRLSHG